MTALSHLFLGGAVLALMVLPGLGVAAAGPLDAPGYAKAFACSACHGFAGNSPSQTVPILAGMPAWYFRKAIDDYASGKGDAAKGVPDLTGQPAGYLLNQMLLFKTDRRSPGDAALQQLKTLIRPIPEATLADLAAYYSSLR
jgi:cytochrome c553